MEKTPHHELLENLFEIMEGDFDQVLSEIEHRNEKQLAEMEIIKNMVNECIRELSRILKSISTIILLKEKAPFLKIPKFFH